MIKIKTDHFMRVMDLMHFLQTRCHPTDTVYFSALVDEDDFGSLADIEVDADENFNIIERSGDYDGVGNGNPLPNGACFINTGCKLAEAIIKKYEEIKVKNNGQPIHYKKICEGQTPKS